MYVCVFVLHSHTVQPISMKLSRDDLYIQGEVDIYLVRKKTNPTHATGKSMKLTNRIAAYENVKGVGSEGGQRPSEHTCATVYTKGEQIDFKGRNQLEIIEII